MLQGFTQALLDAVPDALLAVDAKTNQVVAANGCCEALFERSLEELSRVSFLDSLVPEEREGARILFDEMASSEVANLGRFTILTGKERRVTCEIHSRFAKGSQPIIIHVLRDISRRTADDAAGGLVREMTNQRRSAETLARIEKLEALGILAAGIAHDFNNLVAGAFGHVEMAREYIIEDKVTSAVDCLAEAAGTFNRARELTRQLLTFSKGGAPQKKPGNFGPFVRRIVESALSGSNVDCQFTIEDAACSVAFDESQIAQVIESLIANARQAMPLGGTVDVSISVVQINLGASLPLSVGTYTKISIKDAGVGIPLENMQKLFDPFFTTKTEGTGLGLASSFSIVKRHGGHLEVESELGNGTVCSVYIPHDAESLAEPRNTTSNRPTRQGRILVMDDEDSVRRVTCSLLMRLGYEVVPAADGGEAIEIYRRTLTSGNRFAFVILDLTVPGGLGGRETLASISEMDPNVIAIATTGYSNDPILANPEAYGFRAGLAKPYSRQEFIGLIGRVTG